MARESFDYTAHFEIPNDHLGILAGTSNESIALAHIDICNEIQVTMQAGLEGESVTVPHLKDTKRNKYRQTQQC